MSPSPNRTTCTPTTGRLRSEIMKRCEDVTRFGDQCSHAASYTVANTEPGGPIGVNGGRLEVCTQHAKMWTRYFTESPSVTITAHPA